MSRDVGCMDFSGSKSKSAESVRQQLQMLEHGVSDVVIGPRCRVAAGSCFYSLHQRKGHYAEVGKAGDRNAVRALFLVNCLGQ